MWYYTIWCLLTDEDDIPGSWYNDISEDIDWTMYDKEEEDITQVTDSQSVMYSNQ